MGWIWNRCLYRRVPPRGSLLRLWVHRSVVHDVVEDCRLYHSHWFFFGWRKWIRHSGCQRVPCGGCARCGGGPSWLRIPPRTGRTLSEDGLLPRSFKRCRWCCIGHSVWWLAESLLHSDGFGCKLDVRWLAHPLWIWNRCLYRRVPPRGSLLRLWVHRSVVHDVVEDCRLYHSHWFFFGWRKWIRHSGCQRVPCGGCARCGGGPSWLRIPPRTAHQVCRLPGAYQLWR